MKTGGESSSVKVSLTILIPAILVTDPKAFSALTVYSPLCEHNTLGINNVDLLFELLIVNVSTGRLLWNHWKDDSGNDSTSTSKIQTSSSLTCWGWRGFINLGGFPVSFCFFGSANKCR